MYKINIILFFNHRKKKKKNLGSRPNSMFVGVWVCVYVGLFDSRRMNIMAKSPNYAESQ